MDERTDPGWRTQVRRVGAFLAPHRGTGFVILALTMVMAGVNAIEPLVLKWIFDLLAEIGTRADVASALAAAVGVLLLVVAVREVLTAGSNWVIWRVRLGIHQDVLDTTVAKLHRLPMEYHGRTGVGGLITRIDRGIGGLLAALQEIGTSVLPAFVYLIVAIVVMFQLDWRLSLLVLAFAPIPPLIGIWAAPEQTRRESDLLDRWVALHSRFNEVLSGMMTVKSFVMEEQERRRFLAGVREANQVVIRGVGRDSRVGAARNGVAALARVAAIGMGAWLVLRGEITVGTVIAFMGYVSGLFGPVQGLTQAYGTMRRATVSLNAIYDILDTPDALMDPARPEPLGEVRGHVEFRHVVFGFRPDTPVLHGIELDVPPGEMLAIVGPSGSGKTTLMALLQRLYDPWTGQVSMDGHDLRRVRQKELRANIGVVLQEALLFQDSVRNNIAYGRPSASFEEVVAAAEAASADAFVRKLPGGYEANVGERGAQLSVGQRQRIAIARALLKDPPVLVLDEPTAALDVESEAAVQDALERLMSGRTTFIIAHRLSTVVNADRIVVLADGRIVEQGSHTELVARGGYYASMVELQVGGLLREDRRGRRRGPPPRGVSERRWSELRG